MNHFQRQQDVIHNKKSQVKWNDIIAVGVVVLFSSLLLWRLFHGFDWSDDSYYSAIVFRIIQGDSLFKEIWDIHQLSAVILVPLFWIYVQIAGTTGIILFSRIIFALILAGETIGIYFKFKSYCGRLFSALASIILFSVSSNCGLSYNTIMIEAYIMALLILPSRNARDNLWLRHLLSGFFCGIAVQDYPTTGIVLVCFVAYFIIVDRNWMNFLYFIIGGGIVLIAFLCFLSVNSSFTNLLENYHYLFMDPEHGQINFSIKKHFDSLLDLAGRRSIIILLFTDLIAAISWFTKGKSKDVLKAVSMIGALVVLLQQVLDAAPGYGLSLIQYKLYFVLALLFPTIWLLSGLRWDDLLLMYLGGMIASIGVSISTNNDASFYVYPYLISAIATVLYIGRALSGIDLKIPLYQMIAGVPIGLLTVSLIAASVKYVYRDGELKNLNTRMTFGPAAGIYTTGERAEQYEETVNAINRYMPKEGNVLYTKLLPFGYLCSDAKPATPRLWRTNLDYFGFEEYYDSNPDKLPDAIYIVNENYGITNDGIVLGEYMLNYIDSSLYNTIELDCATILRLRGQI